MNIPEFLKPFFWEYCEGVIDTSKHAHLIMERIMIRGSWKAMHWLRHTYSAQQIKTFLVSKGVNVLPPRELNYWLLITNTAPEEWKTLVATAKKRQISWRRHAH
jgi:hypothetical protein